MGILIIITILITMMSFFFDQLNVGNLISFVGVFIAIIGLYIKTNWDAKKRHEEADARNIKEQKELQKRDDKLLEFEKDILQMKIQIKELDQNKMDVTLCAVHHQHTQESIKKIEKLISDHQTEITGIIKSQIK